MLKHKIETQAASPLAGLQKYVPMGVLHMIEPLVEGYGLLIKIKAPRKSKFGDYRPLIGNRRHRHQITMNCDLNQYAFLVTLLHEIAHMYVFEKYRDDVKPHGTEWQRAYARLLRPFLEAAVFPPDLQEALEHHIEGVTASSCTDHNLFLVLKRYDPVTDDAAAVLLEELAHGTLFKWRNGLVFRKEDKMRKRYKCTEVKSKRIWFFHPMAEVERFSKEAA